MPATSPNNRAPGPTPPAAPPPPTASRRALVLLGLMLAAMWFWKSTNERADNPTVPYSQLYAWVQADKVQSVVFRGDAVDATLKNPEKIDGRELKTFHSNVPPSDAALLPLMRDKG
ncbi:MAG: ATP-dependent metallopeptidase FtsH/Yme1/Tma family protein, partial [Pseudomonadota bacterium]